MKNATIKNDDMELLNVCDKAGHALYTATRKQIHAEGLIHRVIHLWFTDGEYLCFQQRSFDKEAFPLGYDISCAGHIDPNEAAEAACIRECYEELGILLKEADIQKIGVYYEEIALPSGMDKELADVFLCRRIPKAYLLNDEVLAFGKIKIADIVNMLNAQQSSCNFYDLLQPQAYQLAYKDIFLHEIAYYQWLLNAIFA